MPRPIATINPLVGDASFVARHGRLPTAADNDTERIATHLAFAEQILRAVPVPPVQRAARTELLDVLRDYIAARRFPLPEAVGGRLPAFVDREGTRCAVAALVDHAAGADAVARIDARFHDAFVADIDDDALAVLAAGAGLTRAELALIQPSYSYLPPEPPAIVWQADLTTAGAVASGASDNPVLGLIGLGARWEGHHNYYLGDPIVAVDASAGADSGGHMPYSVEARVGIEMLGFPGSALGTCSTCNGHRTGALIGVRVDADGSRVPRAWTIPVDAYWYTPWPSNHGLHLGVVGGVHVQFAGADRALGWSTGLDLLIIDTRERAFEEPFHPHDWHIRLGVDQVADLTLVGVTVGFSTAGRYYTPGEDW